MHESEKWRGSRSVVSYPQRPHGLQPTRLLRPWDFPGKSTGVGCHCILHIIVLCSILTLFHFCMLNHPCFIGINPIWSWCIILFMLHWILFANILLKYLHHYSEEGFSGGSAVKKKKKKVCLPMQETCVWSLSQEDLLEKEMATLSSILAWKIPWTEAPGGL